MQTRYRDSALSRAPFKRVFAALAALTALATLSSCAMPRYVGKAESQQQDSPCETAYYTAHDADAIAQGEQGWAPLLSRYHAAQLAAVQWRDVAALCPERFDEGTIRSARSRRTATAIGARIGQTPASGETDLRDVDALDIDATALAGMALAEDRAGFTVELLTARGSADASLALADEHKASAERLISLSGVAADADPRQKVYDVSQLLAAPHTIVDPATGLIASTVAVAEVNCAREELAAVGTDAGAGDASGANGASGSGDAAGTAVETGGSGNADSLTADSERAEALRVLARLIASRFERAFEAGYPAGDHALFA